MFRRLAVSALFLSLTLSVFAMKCHGVDSDVDPHGVKEVECAENVFFCEDLVVRDVNVSTVYREPGCGRSCNIRQEGKETVIRNENGIKLSLFCCGTDLCNSAEYLLGGLAQ